MNGPCTLLVETNPDDKSLAVIDVGNGKLIYKVKPCNTAVHCKRAVFEIRGDIEYKSFSLKKKIATLHARCDGYSTSSNDIRTYRKKLLTMSKNEVLQHHTKLTVKLFHTFRDKCASLETEEHGALLDDFSYLNFFLETDESLEKDKDNCVIIGSWSKKDLTIYKAGSERVIAKVLPMNTNDKFKVDVSSNVDCAFVLSLIAAVDCLKDPGAMKTVGKAIGRVFEAAAGVALVAEGISFVG